MNIVNKQRKLVDKAKILIGAFLTEHYQTKNKINTNILNRTL